MATSRSALFDSLTGWGIYVVAFLPAAFSFWLGATGGLGADPVRAFEQTLGLWALRFLILTLAITPFRQLARVNLLRFRRALGLLAFWYAAMHFGVYLTLDRGLIWSTIIPDIARRPFITLGFAALMLLVPLAVTSNRLSIRRLGKRWRQLHKLVYVAIVLAAIHYILATKVLDPTQALHVGLVVLLIGYRLVRWLLPQQQRRVA